MSIALDLHTHSYHSDGIGFPDELPGKALANCPEIRYLALTDHNTYSGCAPFMAACADTDITGLVCSEISGSHRDIDTEFHFLTHFGTTWNNDVARRTGRFQAQFNRLASVDTQNVFRFLEALSTQGIDIGYREINQHMVSRLTRFPPERYVPTLDRVCFRDLRSLMQARGMLDEGETLPAYEKRIWSAAGIPPLPTPHLDEVYGIFQETRPRVILAHPMRYGHSVATLRPLIQEWMTEIGLIGLEAHYAGTLHPEWNALAQELDLVVSVGSDSHSMYSGQKGSFHAVPVVEEDTVDVTRLIDVITA